MKFNLLILLLINFNLQAEEKTTFCTAIDGGSLTIQFDEIKQSVISNKKAQTKVSIDNNEIKFWNQNYAYNIRRDNGAMMIFLKDELVGVLECSKPI